MHPIIRATAPLLMALALAACGGGGGSPGASSSGNSSGSSGGTATNPDGSWLSFTPNPVQVSGYEGESIPFKITATSSRTFTKPFNVAIVDTSGTITTDVQISALNEMTYQASLSTSPKLPAGLTQVNLEVRLCEDAPLTCSKPLPGSPWKVPLKVNVKSTTEAAKRLALSAQSLQAVTYAGEQVQLNLDGTFTGDLLGTQFLVGVYEKGGLSNVSYTQSAQGFNATLKSAATLQPGEYNSNVEVRLCRDDPATCRLPIPGSPWIIPLKLTVKNASNLTTLLRVPGVGAWSSFQGNASHSGFIDATFDATKFSRRFSLPASAVTESTNSVATDNGKVFMTLGKSFDSEFELLAISEADGSILWRSSLGKVNRANSPAVGNGYVFVVTVDVQSNLWVFDQQNGNLVSKTAFGSNTGSRAPTVAGTDVFSMDGYDYDRSMTAFSSSLLSKRWSSPMQSVMRSSPTPAVDLENVYVFLDGKLRVLDTSNGNLKWAVSGPDANTLGGQSVTLSGNLALTYGSVISAYDLTLRTVAWSVANSNVVDMAVGNGMVYSVAGMSTVLEARSLSDGKLQWTSESLGQDNFRSVVVVRNLAFVSGRVRTVAVDLATHKVVWSYPRGGNLSISSNGVLYIMEDNRSVSAINLQ
ncbi:PQQ-binding-like beta-propeller repeat protein [Pseudoduganella sp. R-34]|uniref:PQQ-binding-like beta-propeller repeat protein n=1 Tax=Pseudoduganella sp. R-34 TaxID=3404062 RepID=UPI003CF009E5